MMHNFIFDQENLEALCKDRNFQTNELFQPNDYYGQASILKKYIGCPNNYCLKAILQHGLTFSDFVWDAELSAKLPIFLSPSSERAALYRNKTFKPSMPIGFGFLYAISEFHNRYGKQIGQDERRGTVVFPSHSTHHITAKFDFKEYAKTLEDLPDKFKPVVVCIYWKDFLLGHHLEYLKRGFKVITAGHIYDSLFLLRLYDICRQFKYATSNDIGTHLFAAIKSGCSFFYSGLSEINHENSKDMSLAINPKFAEVKCQSILLFDQPADYTNPDQERFVDSFLGTQHFRSRHELRLIVLYAELCDKLRWNLAGKHIGFDNLPTYWQRKRPVIGMAKCAVLRLTQRILSKILSVAK